MNIVYVLCDRHVGKLTWMTWVSVQTLRRFHPYANVTILCDSDTERACGGYFTDCEIVGYSTGFDTDVESSRWIKCRTISLQGGDFIFLDSDTLVLGSLDPLWRMSDDLCAAIDLNRKPKPVKDFDGLRSFFERVDWPIGDTFVFNSGVFRAGRSAKVQRLGELWPEYWHRGLDVGTVKDQPSFWTAIYQSELAVNILDAKYNALVMKNPRLIRKAVIAHFWQSSYGASLIDYLASYAEKYRTLDLSAIETACRQGLPWKPDAMPWQLCRSGHYIQAAVKKIRGWSQLLPVSLR